MRTVMLTVSILMLTTWVSFAQAVQSKTKQQYLILKTELVVDTSKAKNISDDIVVLKKKNEGKHVYDPTKENVPIQWYIKKGYRVKKILKREEYNKRKKGWGKFFGFLREVGESVLDLLLNKKKKNTKPSVRSPKKITRSG